MSSVNNVLCHHTYGKPEEVVTLEKRPVPDLQPNEILVETLYAPINPAEINMLEGKYGRLRPLPVTPGYDSVGVIVEIGADVTEFAEGDHVITPQVPGAWAHYRAVEARYAFKVPSSIPLEVAAMLNVNPMTALAMLTEFTTLNEDDWVIQNAANSGVGRAVIDIAKEMGLNTINIVRREELVEEIKDAGGTIVVTHEQVKNKVLKEKAKEFNIKLGFNAVGGDNARLLARQLCDEGIMVTYGAMSKEPVIIDNGLLIFKNIVATGFWRSKWLEQADQDKITTLYNRLIVFAEKGAFRVDVEAMYPFEEASAALTHAQKDKRKGKILFTTIN